MDIHMKWNELILWNLMVLQIDIIYILVLKTNKKSLNSRRRLYFITENLWTPATDSKTSSSTSGYHLGLKYSSKNQTSPNSMGLCRFKTDFPWPPSVPLSILKTKYSSKRIICRVMTFYNEVTMATFQLQLNR